MSAITFTVDGVELPTTLDTVVVARDFFHCSTDALYESVRAGTCPVEPLRLGRRLRWPTARVLEVLGIVRDTDV